MSRRALLVLVGVLYAGCSGDDSARPGGDGAAGGDAPGLDVGEVGSVERTDVPQPDGSFADGAFADVASVEGAGVEAREVGAPGVDVALDLAPEAPAPKAACVSYCRCMKATCSTYSGYPWTTEKACLDRCDVYSPEQLACFPYYCDKVAMDPASQKKHSCEHAWGSQGLKECP